LVTGFAPRAFAKASATGWRLAAAALVGALAFLPGALAAQGLVRDAETEATLRRIAEPVFRGGAVSPDSIDLYIVGDRRPNAFVAGGRNIFVHTGLLMRLTSPAQIQAVLAHELGHINGGHLARRGIEVQRAGGAVALGALLAIAAGIAGSPDAAAAVFTGSLSVVTRGLLAFTRGEEASADQAALSYLEAARINPTGMIEVLEMFRGQEVLAAGHVDPYARTHPMSVDRMLLIRKRLETSPWNTARDSPDLVYRFERMRAKLDGFLERPERVLAQLDPKDDSEFALIRRAVALHRRPDPAGALAAVERLVAKRPSDPYYHELKAQILLESGKVAEAVPEYRRALALAPHEPLIRASLARALLARGAAKEDAEALGLLEQAVRDDPANAGALRDLALAYARGGKEGLAALTTAERYALQTRFKDAAIHARRAVALLPEGSPGWLKAQDIILLSDRVTK
jgi:predicted Zn-dependent protease